MHRLTPEAMHFLLFTSGGFHSPYTLRFLPFFDIGCRPS